MEETYKPEWVRPGGKVDEVKFCEAFLQDHPMVCVDGSFFTEEGRISDEGELRKEIYDWLSKFFNSGLARKVEAIVGALRMDCRVDSLDNRLELLNVANGTYDVFLRYFVPQKQICRNRLPVAYNPKAPEPVNWLRFLEDLLEPEDIPILQEFMGYCLIPTTAAQKMLIITGRGGEGKSRIAVVMKALLGSNMSTGSVAKVETDRFARADLEHLLLMVDDDLKMEALNQTNNLKSIITAELPMDLERKGIQSYQGEMTVRFMAFGNGNLQALHDRSYGFFRRQIILSAKPHRPDRVDDPYLGQKLKDEAEGIFLWCLRGLERLLIQDYRFTVSRHAEANIKNAMLDSVNILEFLQSEGYIRLDPAGSVSSRQLYNIYKDWCDDNAVFALSSRSFWIWLRENAAQYGLTHTTNLPVGNNRKARGFLGIRACPRM